MRSADLINDELEGLKKAKQAINKAQSRANRKKRRVSQRAGQLILEVPSAIRVRVMDVLDAIVGDEELLERCERSIAGEAERKGDGDGVSTPLSEAAE